MVEGPDRRAPPAVELDESLLEAKLSAPSPNAGSVSRSALIDRARGSGCRVVGVTAPAGYGKSTLLAQWAASEERGVAWVSFDRFDDDPSVLLRLLASAYSRITPGDGGLVGDMGGLGVSVLGRAAPRLASALRSSPAPFVFLLDDLHELQSPACHDVLSVVISGIPRDSQLVTASRTEQPHLPRMRAAGDGMEFMANDMALDAAAAEHIFAGAHVSVTSDVAAAVTERTEGWPVGLYLAAMIARDQPGAALTVSGDDRYVTDYLYHEALARLPQRTQRFLRRTAVLDQMCAALCDAILGEPGSQERLRGLEASNLFLIPLDRRREWYRYHSLFREFLLGELRRVEPELIMKLQLRAADWYEAAGAPAMALEYLLNTTERDRCIQLVTALTLPTYQAGQMSTVQRWMSSVGMAPIEAYPPLAVLAGWIAVLTGQTVEAQRLSAFLEGASFDLAPLDGSASFASARAMLRSIVCPAGPEQAMADASLAVEQETPWSPWRDQALTLLGEAHLLLGDEDQAAAAFEEASALAATMSNGDSFVLSESELALLALDASRWSEAAEHLDRALAAVDEHRMRDYATSVLAFALAGRLAVHRGDAKEAELQLTRAMRARPTCTFVLPYLAVRVRLQLALAYLGMGDSTTASHLLKEIDDVLLKRPQLGVLVDEVNRLRASVTARTRAGRTGLSPLTPAELRLLPYLQTHLTMREIGERLLVSRNTVNSEVGSIYRKLGVSSRSEAVRGATTAGLLGG